MTAQTNQRIDGKRLWDSLMAHGGDRRHAEGRRAAADADRCGPARPRPVPRRVRGGGADRAGGRDRQHVRPPRRPRSEPPAGAVRQPSRQPAVRRQVRRRAGRAGRARGDAHAERPRHRHRGAARAGELDRRGGQPLRPFADGVGGVVGRVLARQGLCADRRGGRDGADRAGRDRLSRPGAGGRIPGRCLFRAAHRAGADPGARGEADRHRHRRAGDGVVRRGRHRPGFACRHHAAGRRARTRWCARRGSSTWWIA